MRIVSISAVLAALAAAAPAPAELVRIEIESRGELPADEAIGVPRYAKLAGRFHFAIDPLAPENAAIADVRLAPRNAAGKVEFAADFALLRPADRAAANGTLLYEVANRGRKGLLNVFNHGGSASDPTPADLGDGFLLRHGYTLLWVGWQHDVPQEEGLVRTYVPQATDGGRELRGLVRADFVPTAPTRSQRLSDRGHVAYPAREPDAERHTLTVRDSPLGPREIVPRSAWRFAREENGRIVPDPTHVYLASGFEPFRIYEVIYESANPPVAGLGLAAIRDAVGALKHDGAAALDLPSGSVERAIGFGLSQSGRLLRQFLYDGFNTDERGRAVFDGLLVHIAGGARGSFNHRFAQPSRAGWSHFYPNEIFPFADARTRDPVTGRADGLLARAPAESLPRIFYTNSSNEYWRGSAALTHVSPDGRRDLELPAHVRTYLLAGTQHVPAAFPPPKGDGVAAANPNDYRWFLKALLVRLDRWIADGEPPPPSRYPRLDDGTLVRRDALDFPTLAALPVPERLRAPRRIDFGSRFAAERVIEREPPAVGPAFPLLLPQVDEDGNELAGLRSPELAAPLATYTGFSLYDPAVGPPDELVSLIGSYVPFPATAAERAAAGDPRRAIEERYADRDAYLARVRTHASALAAEGYLLEEDLAAIEAAAARHWDALVR